MPPIELLDKNEVPEWFTYPSLFLTIVNQGLVDFHPWHVLDRDNAKVRLKGLSQRFPDMHLVPFAARTDCDFVACFLRGDLNGVVVLKDFSQPRKVLQRYDSIQDWVRAAIEDFLAFEPEGGVWTPP